MAGGFYQVLGCGICECLDGRVHDDRLRMRTIAGTTIYPRPIDVYRLTPEFIRGWNELQVRRGLPTYDPARRKE